MMMLLLTAMTSASPAAATAAQPSGDEREFRCNVMMQDGSVDSLTGKLRDEAPAKSQFSDDTRVVLADGLLGREITASITGKFKLFPRIMHLSGRRSADNYTLLVDAADRSYLALLSLPEEDGEKGSVFIDYFPPQKLKSNSTVQKMPLGMGYCDFPSLLGSGAKLQ